MKPLSLQSWVSAGPRAFGGWIPYCWPLLWPLPPPAQVVINELMADNETAVPNGSDHPDYVELYNPSIQAVSLAGMSLTDDPAQPRKFVFPAGATIPAQGYFMVWCDTNTLASGLHTGFGLGADGDELRLYAANGITILTELVFGLQVPDFSVGRVPDGAITWAFTQPTPRAANEVQALGASGALRLNEWMARPPSGDDWLEVFNGSTLPVALGGLVITDTPSGTPANRAIPALSFIGGRGFARFFASDLDKPDADHLDFKLSTSAETLTIYAADRATVIDRVTDGAQQDYISQGRAPDGSDHIVFFPAERDTPNEPNFAAAITIAISEVLSHTDPPLSDAIELHNPTAAAVDISYWWLSDSSAQPKKYRIPAGTIVPAGGFKVFYEYQFGVGTTAFTLDSAEGDEVYLSASDAAGNLTGAQIFVEFGALKNGVSVGRHRTSINVDFVPLRQRTFGVDNPASLPEFWQGTGLSNAAARVGPIVISEIHYAPAETADEFIELHNPNTQSVPLYDPSYPTNQWRLREGVSFNFPANVMIPSGGCLLLVSFDPVAEPAVLSAFRAKFDVPADLPVLGPYEGKLSDTGEGVRLLWPDRPEPPPDPNAGFVPYEWVERIKYSSVAPWPADAAGTGKSLQRRAALDYGNDPLNWFAATPTPGRASAVDSDHDGMPDAWETAHGLNPFSDADALLDLDHDGASNMAECCAGTHPYDAQSVFEICSLATVPDGLHLTFLAVAGHTYTLQGRRPVESGSWQNLTNLAAVDMGGERTIAVPVSQIGSRLFRVITPALP